MHSNNTEFILATGNAHKAQEIRALLGPSFTIKSLKDIAFAGDIIEDAPTFGGNALIKASTIHSITGGNVIADDSGLVVDALDGAPGIFSARYAGIGATDSMNVAKLLNALQGVQNRKAHFICVIALVLNGLEYLFEGKVHGTIAMSLEGEGGFGYDPVFIPNGYDRSFATFTSDEKNAISHRAIALGELKNFLKSL